ncbi:DUF4238 domain-containing protein [Pseudooceanicola sp. 216_PA32_1]|uniref:DUF4238 domain-containing protein n=1 Tax=Pseudooceanicola pacificus TaxID=2676438 RepID=A0A844WEL0_9RHOB|nr:DUF4238 domain-containing protein [Pseudooceanicola pacificus]MWB79838.1 DUF4238 domain-containing protein [Pseudooceanicola pacificus]
MSDPVDHHYLAVFYLNRWAGGDDKVCRFNRPHGDRVVSKRVSPKGTAYEEHLYSMRTPDGPPIADMERDFMSRLDSEAAEALGLLEQGLPESKWEQRLRSAWSRFVWAQSIRTPSEIAQLKSSVKEAWSEATPGLQAAYEAERPEGAPESVDDWLATLDPHTEDRFALTIARRSMDHSGIGQIINNMRWMVLDFEGCGIPLLTSDRPVWMTMTLSEPNAFILMPIGPTRLFVASRETETMLRIAAQNRRQQAKSVNKTTVQHAVKFVFGVDHNMKSFVQKHFAARRHSTHMERFAAMRGHEIVAEESPLG